MENEEPDPQQVDAFLVYGAYGDVMLGLQRLEMAMLSIAAAEKIKEGSTLDQGLARLSAWEKQPMGRIANMLDLPPSLADELAYLVDRRNRLAHHFFADYPGALSTSEGRRRLLEDLVTLRNRLEECDEGLEDHLREEGVDVDWEPSAEELREILGE